MRRAQGTAPRPGQYLDPVSVGSLIVAIAALTWNIYSDLRKKTPEPRPEVTAGHVRAELRKTSQTSQQEASRITEIVVTEIIWVGREPADPVHCRARPGTLFGGSRGLLQARPFTPFGSR